MDEVVKRELISGAVQALAVPLARAGINHHYKMKQMDKQEEMAMKMAERKQRGFRALAGGERAAVGPAGGRQEPVALDNPGDVYDELENLRTETDCQFCHSVIDNLMEAPPGEAKDGYEELRSYVREVERIKERDVTEEQAEEIVGELVDRWEVVPRYAAGMA